MQWYRVSSKMASNVWVYSYIAKRNVILQYHNTIIFNAISLGLYDIVIILFIALRSNAITSYKYVCNINLQQFIITWLRCNIIGICWQYWFAVTSATFGVTACPNLQSLILDAVDASSTFAATSLDDLFHESWDVWEDGSDMNFAWPCRK